MLYFSFLLKLWDKRDNFYLPLIRQYSQYFNIIIIVPFLKTHSSYIQTWHNLSAAFFARGKKRPSSVVITTFFLRKQLPYKHFSDYLIFHVRSCLPFPQTSNMLWFYCQSAFTNLSSVLLSQSLFWGIFLDSWNRCMCIYVRAIYYLCSILGSDVQKKPDGLNS